MSAAEAPAQRLSQAEVDKILAEAKEKPELPGIARDRRVHGEFGVEVGTGGYRAAYGAIAVPIGERGGATLSFETARLPGFDLEQQRRRHSRSR